MCTEHLRQTPANYGVTCLAGDLNHPYWRAHYDPQLQFVYSTRVFADAAAAAGWTARPLNRVNRPSTAAGSPASSAPFPSSVPAASSDAPKPEASADKGAAASEPTSGGDTAEIRKRRGEGNTLSSRQAGPWKVDARTAAALIGDAFHTAARRRIEVEGWTAGGEGAAAASYASEGGRRPSWSLMDGLREGVSRGLQPGAFDLRKFVIQPLLEQGRALPVGRGMALRGIPIL